MSKVREATDVGVFIAMCVLIVMGVLLISAVADLNKEILKNRRVYCHTVSTVQGLTECEEVLHDGR